MIQVSIEVLTDPNVTARQQIAAIEAQVWEAEDTPETRARREARVEEELAAPNRELNQMLVARTGIEERIVGVCRIMQTTAGPQVWLLYGLAVHPDYRHHGVGRTLVEAAMGRARAAGATTLRSYTRPTNEASLAFHQTLGFQRVKRRYIAPNGDEMVGLIRPL